MANKNFVQGFNGVSYGAVITVLAQDVTDGYIEGRFSNESGTPYPLAFNVQVKTSANVNVPLVDAVLLFNTDVTGGINGSFRIEDGASTFALVADQVINITAQPARDV